MPHAIEHIQSLWSPAHLLAQCEAHTAILDRHHARTVMVVDYEYYEPGAQACAECTQVDGPFDLSDDPDYVLRRFPCPTWHDVALAYRHNNGYREEWRP
ncbi:DUF6221 family protein [Actinosynnema sp. NPDC023587]|uniref:DUF6221 family protein n=1 Tax=Actinosynnema sp. NPDC023587 TaxID=3154695 RepID=UPI0033FD37DB